MKNMIVMALLTLCSSAVFASADCPVQPKEKWQKESDFQKKLTDEGYKIKKFKIDGNCYEIYGWNKEGQKVEIYFNPVDGSIVKSKIK